MYDSRSKSVAYFNYRRRSSSIVRVGNIPMGGTYPVRLQSMTTTPTTDTESSVEQCKRIISAGGEYVRLTTQGMREAENLRSIRKALHDEGIYTPLVADVHFNPAVADAAAAIVEAVRINPGNYVDSARTFKHLEYTDEEYAEEVKRIDERLRPLLNLCRVHHTALRIGVNHGSLSDRIMSRYGDTPAGIVESCMEFLRICKRENFREVVISIKASDTAVMVRSVRLLVQQMEREGMRYPLHLGVTEAGEGEDGRIKSAVGIGALLSDGIGDTIRVSLSEAPENEIPVARKMRDYILAREGLRTIGGRMNDGFNYVSPQRRRTEPVFHVGGENAPVVIADYNDRKRPSQADFLYCGARMPKSRKDYGGAYIVDANAWRSRPNVYPAFSFHMLSQIDAYDAPLKFLFLPCPALDVATVNCLREHPELVLILQPTQGNTIGEFRSAIHRMMNRGLTNPIVLFLHYELQQEALEDFQIRSAVDCSAVLFDGLCDGLYLADDAQVRRKSIDEATVEHTAFSLLQAAGLRRTRTEYVSCPGCGRTLYDLQGTIARIKAATQGLPSLKIAVMGCIVNGPGEMADADYGYVGAARGRISLYRGRECVEKNIPEEEAVAHLLQLLRNDGVLNET
ncbi:MAG: 4-hydroxy-3-methylbut-2-en-1-yl diphosphate synthase [Bacteroidaceae bacterium]|nr:4-hydroxy-3-methylbut-2-en-1-yl diphosphate synthase [Bacteroidaceae bacterium]